MSLSQSMACRQGSAPPLSLVEDGWESVPPVHFVKVEGDNSTMKDVSSHKLAKKIAPSLYMASPSFWGMARVPVPSTPSSGQRRLLLPTAMLVLSTELTFVPKGDWVWGPTTRTPPPTYGRGGFGERSNTMILLVSLGL